MSNAAIDVSEHDAIAKTVQHYIDGAKSGRGEDMKPAFHKDATIFGYAGADLFAGPIQRLFDWNDENGPASACGLKAQALRDLVDDDERPHFDALARRRVFACIREVESRMRRKPGATIVVAVPTLDQEHLVFGRAQFTPHAAFNFMSSPLPDLAPSM